MKMILSFFVLAAASWPLRATEPAAATVPTSPTAVCDPDSKAGLAALVKDADPANISKYYEAKKKEVNKDPQWNPCTSLKQTAIRCADEKQRGAGLTLQTCWENAATIAMQGRPNQVDATRINERVTGMTTGCNPGDPNFDAKKCGGATLPAEQTADLDKHLQKAAEAACAGKKEGEERNKCIAEKKAAFAKAMKGDERTPTRRSSLTGNTNSNSNSNINGAPANGAAEQTKEDPPNPNKWNDTIAGAKMGLWAGLIGFIFAGPAGALLCAMAGFGAGYFIHKLS